MLAKALVDRGTKVVLLTEAGDLPLIELGIGRTIYRCLIQSLFAL